MSGVRLRHPTLTNCVFTVEDVDRPYRSPIQCLMCKETHYVKTYHLRLDGGGTVIVSPEILGQLKKLPALAGLTVENEVTKPPAQTIGVGGKAEPFRIERHEF
jgi:hypothetical protein